ncbi:MAG: hypothetical protein Q4D04_02070 [Clostridia bacterium]|nr:hypothetical protein [Clostridia bacterium]
MYRKAIILIVALTCLLSGSCLAQGTFFEYSDGCVSFAADVEGGNYSQAPVLRAKTVFWDPDWLADVLLDGYEYREVTDEGYTPKSTYLGEKVHLRIVGQSAFRLTTDVSDKLSNVVNVGLEPYCAANMPAGDAGFMSVADVEKASVELMKTLGLDCQFEGIYRVTRTEYNRVYNRLIAFNNELGEGNGGWGALEIPDYCEWPDEDIAYAVFLRQQYDGIPAFRDSYAHKRSGIALHGTDISLAYDHDGIIRVVVRYPFSVIEAGSPQKLISYVKAAQIFAEDRNMILGDYAQTYMISRISLQYVPVSRKDSDDDKAGVVFTLQPAWVIESISPTVQESGLPADYIPEYFLVDAIEGYVMGSW